MYRMIFSLADLVIIVDGDGMNEWVMYLKSEHDTFKATLNSEELAAIMAMAIGSEEGSDWIENLRPMVERLLKDCPPSCMPIP